VRDEGGGGRQVSAALKLIQIIYKRQAAAAEGLRVPCGSKTHEQRKLLSSETLTGTFFK